METLRFYNKSGVQTRLDLWDWAFITKLGDPDKGVLVISTANSAFSGKVDRIRIPPGDSPVTIDVFEHLRLGANRKLVFDGDWQGLMIDFGEDAPVSKWIGLLPADPGPAWYMAIVDDKGVSFRQSSARDWGTQKVLIDFVNSLVKLDAGYKLWFGDDVNLYRKDADWLKTDDRFECLYLFIPTPGLGWDNAIKIYDSGSRIQRVDADTFAFTMPNTTDGQIAFDVDGVGIKHRFYKDGSVWHAGNFTVDGWAKVGNHKYSPITVFAPEKFVNPAGYNFGIRFVLPAGRTLKLWRVFGWTDAGAGNVYARIKNVTDGVILDDRDLSGGLFVEGTPLGSWSYTANKSIEIYVYNSNTTDSYWGSAVWVITIE